MQPVKRTSPAKRDKRRSHHAITATRTVACPNCGSPKLPHAACDQCGYVRPGLFIKQDAEEE
ncbi:MAG: 50S ribosomal protein L32 [Desulfobacterales bacterium]|nr:50S ribosomal protein L32 [Desulfobacterales bacterium]